MINNSFSFFQPVLNIKPGNWKDIMKKLGLIFWGCTVLATSALPQIKISELHQNTSEGIIENSDRVSIEGTTLATGTRLLGQALPEIFVQDATAGILVCCAQSFKIGDSLRIYGPVAQHEGLTHLLADSIIYLGTGVLPEPFPLTCSQVNHALDENFLEAHESRLIRLNEVTSRNTTPFITLLDQSGPCKLFLEPNTGVSSPSGNFSIIGLLIQKDASRPFTGDYYIMPRFPSDIIYKGAPKLVELPFESDLQSHQVTISWVTSNDASSVIKFGKTMAYELGRVGDSTGVVKHSQTISNLEPATIYHCRVVSTNALGSVQSGDLLFSTASRVESRGTIYVFFNKSVDTSVQTTQPALGLLDLDIKLMERIEAARHSIDICSYNLALSQVASTLVAAKNRGVSVRLITEAEYDDDRLNSLRAVGVPIINDKLGGQDGFGLMHNKFVIFDARDPSSAADDWVWTGSYNFTYAATTRYAENAILIQDESLAQCYLLEFNEMWGSATEAPDPAQSRFGSLKQNNTPHVFNINGRRVRQYMSPGDYVLEQLYQLVESADFNIRFCIFDFTLESLASRMELQRNLRPGLVVRGVFDSGQTYGSYNVFPQLKNSDGTGWNPPADVWRWYGDNLLHHKYLMIDADHPESNPVVASGSYNWSNSAENSNDENILIFEDAEIANWYFQEFSNRYREAGGSARVAGFSAAPRRAEVAQNFPNPFNRVTRIQFQIDLAAKVTLAVYNLQGQLVKILVDGHRQPGHYAETWDATDATGQEVSSGIYYYRLQSNQEIDIKKLLLVK
jgi:phosphatidylserine/phosphatidylglycerophosphate/cardiolipin synthase-like enzyme